MVRFHPSSKDCKGGFVAMVMVRDPKGRLYGSRTGVEVYSTRYEALFAARDASLRVARELGGVLVSIPTREG